MSATQAAIAQGQGGSAISDQINHSQQMFSHPDYRFEPQFPNTFGQAINITAGQTPSVINLPPTEIYNLSQSFLLYNVNIPAPTTATNFVWTYADTLAEISHIQFYVGANQLIADVDFLQNYLKIVMKKESVQDDFYSLDALNRLYMSNSLNNANPALRHNCTTASPPISSATPLPSFLNYQGPAYFNVGTIGAAVTYAVQFPLRLIKNTIFSIDKSLYLGQVGYLKVYFGPLSKSCYMSTSNATPSAGTPTAYVGAAVTITNYQLMLACEGSENQKQLAMARYMAGDSMIIPYVTANNNSNSGANQNITVQIDGNSGKTLIKVIHSVFNGAQALDAAYDCQNNGTGTVIAQKCLGYYTQLSGRRLQDISVDCAVTFTDYMQQKKMLKGSVLGSLSEFQYNWHHCDDFCNYGPDYDQNNNNLLNSGIPMGALPIVWSFVGTMAATNNSFQHYTYVVTSKLFTCAPAIVSIN